MAPWPKPAKQCQRKEKSKRGQQVMVAAVANLSAQRNIMLKAGLQTSQHMLDNPRSIEQSCIRCDPAKSSTWSRGSTE